MREVPPKVGCIFKKWMLNSLGDVKIVEKLRGQHSHTGCGPGPTLNRISCFIQKLFKTSKNRNMGLKHAISTCSSDVNIGLLIFPTRNITKLALHKRLAGHSNMTDAAKYLGSLY